MTLIQSSSANDLLPASEEKRASRWAIQGAIALGLACGAWVSALAQPAAVSPPASVPAIAVVLTQHKVVKNEKGEEQLVDAGSVKPGDVIEYRATYANKSAKAVTGLVGNLPIPEGLEYLPRSAKPGAALVKAAAADGVFASEPLLRKLPGGKTEPLPYGEYRSLRWTLGQLPAGAVTAVSARARVEAVVPKAPTAPGAVPQASPASAQPAAKQ